MLVAENFSIQPLNSFGMDVRARYFARFSDEDQLGELLEQSAGKKRIILGGGSNILFTEDFNGYVFKNDIREMEVVLEDEHHVYIRVGAGENWHQFVLFCLERELAGVENLSLIPGNVGASPMQNIGAYGVEIKSVFHQMEAYDIRHKKIITFSANDCEFGYRESIFKRKYKDDFVILNVTFRLNKIPEFHTGYGAIEEELARMGEELSIRSIANAVIHIRRAKLPDPKVIGNAGSFFKNPIVPAEKYSELKREYPGIPGYVQEDESVKLAAGWLIEQCGWKGYRKGDAGCHERQALVLVNHGHAKGSEILDLSHAIRDSVRQKFLVELEPEVNIV